MTELFVFVNQNSNFWFGNAILIMTFFVFFLAMKANFTAPRAFSGAIFVTLLVAVFLRVIEMIGDWPLGITVMLLILALFWLRTDDS